MKSLADADTVRILVAADAGMKKLAPFRLAMKTLPRTDPSQYVSLLLRLGIAHKDENSRSLVNPLPYSNTLLYKNTVFRCFGASVCKPVMHIEWNTSNVITLTNLKIFPDIGFKFNVAHVGDVIYVKTMPRYLYVLCEKPFNEIILLDQSWISVEYKKEQYLVHGFSIVMNNGRRISLISNKPLYIECRNRQLIEIEVSYHDSAQLLVSENYTVIDLARKVLSIDNLLNVSGVSIIKVPLIEFLDTISIALPYSIIDNCIEYLVMNSSTKSGNAIVKVYGYIDSIEVNSIKMKNYRHSIVRLAMSSGETTQLKLCISTFTPYAYELRKRLSITDDE